MAGTQSAVGFTVKSGWACAVLLAGPIASPRVADSRKVDLSDPAVPESRQPYHAGFGTARGTGAALTRLVASVERFGHHSVTAMMDHYLASAQHLDGVGVVVGSLIDPERIGNDHIRIHALEGRLFRQVVESAVVQRHLQCAIWRERDLYAAAVGILKRPEPAVRRTVTELGRPVHGSWRAEQKTAALAAWLVLAGGVPATGNNHAAARLR